MSAGCTCILSIPPCRRLRTAPVVRCGSASCMARTGPCRIPGAGTGASRPRHPVGGHGLKLSRGAWRHVRHPDGADRQRPALRWRGADGAGQDAGGGTRLRRVAEPQRNHREARPHPVDGQGHDPRPVPGAARLGRVRSGSSDAPVAGLPKPRLGMRGAHEVQLDDPCTNVGADGPVPGTDRERRADLEAGEPVAAPMSHRGRVSRPEGVEAGRRRRWSDAETPRIVAESRGGLSETSRWRMRPVSPQRSCSPTWRPSRA